MRVALEDVDRADGTGTEEAECHESQTEKEDDPVVLVWVIPCEAKKDVTEQAEDTRQNEVDELVLGDTVSTSLGDRVRKHIGEAACDESDRDSSNQHCDKRISEVGEFPSVCRNR
jgi:hypothetical protein